MKNKKLLTKEINIMVGLCLYDYSQELVENVIKHFPTWRLYKVKYRSGKTSIDGLFLTDLKFLGMKDIKPEEEVITERYDVSTIDHYHDKFFDKYSKKIGKFLEKQNVKFINHDIHFVVIPKDTEILNLGTDDLTFR